MMCYHTANPGKIELIDELPNMRVLFEGDPYYHVSGFTRPLLPITSNAQPDAIIPGQWKLLPYWVKTETEAQRYANTLNAESESIFQKASYKPYIGRQRGLLWVRGFYEPHKNVHTGAQENYFVQHAREKLFTLGIVIAPWTNQDTGEIVQTFSVITTKANALLQEIHNEKKRMPLIIDATDRDAWMNVRDTSQIASLMKPYPGALKGHKIKVRVTADRSGTTNRPDIHLPD